MFGRSVQFSSSSDLAARLRPDTVPDLTHLIAPKRGQTLAETLSDVVIVRDNVATAATGWGDDAVVVMQPISGQYFDLGQGDDLLILGAADPGSVLRVTADWSATFGLPGDQVLLTEFSADSSIDLSAPGQFTVRDTDGDLLYINVTSPAGTPVSLDAFKQMLVLGQGEINRFDLRGGPDVFVSEDVTLAGVVYDDGPALIVVDQNVAYVEAMEGDSVILVELDGVPSDLNRWYSTGAGDNILELSHSERLDFSNLAEANIRMSSGNGTDEIRVTLSAVGLSLDVQAGGDDDTIRLDLRGSSDSVITVSGDAGDDTFVYNDNGPGAGPMDMTTYANLGDDTLIAYTGTTQGSAASRKCYFDSSGVDGMLTLVLPDYGPRAEVYDEDGAVMFRDPDSGATFGCYFCDVDGDLTARELSTSNGFATDLELVLI